MPLVMEKSSRLTENSINLLCDDILVQIFSYVDTYCLITVIYKVCSHWMRLIDNDSRVWRNRWLVWNLSKPVNILHDYLDRAPLLIGVKLISLADVATDKMMKELVCKIPQILKLEVHFAVTTDILHCMNTNIHYLHVTNICRQDYTAVMQFQKIETLKFGNAYDFCGRHLRLIADNCLKLKTLHLGDCRSLITSDILYFLQKKEDQIESIEVSGYGLSDEVFVLLSQCKNLQELRVHDSRLMSYCTLVNIVHSHIKILFLSRLKYRYNVLVPLPNWKFVTLNFDD